MDGEDPLPVPPTSLRNFFMEGMNRVDVTFADQCGGNAGNTDVFLRGNFAVSRTAPELPVLDGGTFLRFWYNTPNSGLECTTAFGTTDTRTGLRLMLSAKHCINNKQGDQKTNDQIAAMQPMRVNTIDDFFRVAYALNCAPPGSAWCVLPASPQPVTGDMFAFKPDTARPSGRVQTALGVLPVFGSRPLNQVSGQVCHYGLGSKAKIGIAEQCGTRDGSSGGLPVLRARVVEGDSGGPVYQYATRQGRLGVYAVGMVEGSNDCHGPADRRICRLTRFVPIDTVLGQLKQTLNTA